MNYYQRLAFSIFVVFATLFAGHMHWKLRQRKFDRGRKLTAVRRVNKRAAQNGLRWGNHFIPESSATQHFLAVGTTGSGKSLIQRMLMRDVLPKIIAGTDCRAVILDAKNDMPAFLRHIDVTCPVYSLNPLEGRAVFPRAVTWDVAADITSPARALNLAAALIPSGSGDANRYFTDAARQVVAGVIESLIRHSPGQWSLADLVYTTHCLDRTRVVLNRDLEGQEVLDGFLGEERTGFQVFTTIVSRMAYFKPVAALWQRNTVKLSLRDYVEDESILLLGVDATARVALDAINEIVFRILVEEIDAQHDSQSRRTWIWIDEARLSGPLLRSDMLPLLAVKGRSKGACLVLAFQDIEGFREAAGDHIAHEIVAQCSHKALLRLESEESAQWASRLIGQHEALQRMHSRPAWFGRGGSHSEQLTKADTVLPSEFYTIPVTSRSSGLSGYFLSPSFGAVYDLISGRDLEKLFVGSAEETKMRFRPQPETAQKLLPWSQSDHLRLSLASEQVLPKSRQQSRDRRQSHQRVLRHGR